MFRFNLIFVFIIVYFLQIYFCVVYGKQFDNHEKEREEQKNILDNLLSLSEDDFKNENNNKKFGLIIKYMQSKYNLQIQLIKEAADLKIKNLEKLGMRHRPEEPIIHINNPVEAGMPNHYLGIDEFKKKTIERVQNEKKEFDMKIDLINNAHKQYEANHHDDGAYETIDEKMHIKQNVKVRPSTKLMKKTLHKRNHKVNKKIKPKVHLSHAIKSTKKPQIKTTTTLSEETVSDEFGTFVDNNQNETVTKMVDSENISKTTTEASVATTVAIEDIITTKSTADEEISTTTVATTPTADGKTTTATEAIADIVTTKLTADVETSTATIAFEDITTETSVNEETTTEMVKDKVTPKPITDTTSKTTIRTTRTRQARPYVFMGNK